MVLAAVSGARGGGGNESPCHGGPSGCAGALGEVFVAQSGSDYDAVIVDVLHGFAASTLYDMGHDYVCSVLVCTDDLRALRAGVPFS